MTPCVPPPTDEVYRAPGYAIICEAPERKSAEDVLKTLGVSCEIFKEQGKEVYRVMCPARTIVTGLKQKGEML